MGAENGSALTVIEVLVGENSSSSKVIFRSNENLSTIWPSMF